VLLLQKNNFLNNYAGHKGMIHSLLNFHLKGPMFPAMCGAWASWSPAVEITTLSWGLKQKMKSRNFKNECFSIKSR
jgi:hypothetical protein